MNKPDKIREINNELMLEDEDTLKDQYLTFHLAGEDYGMEIYYVTEIMGMHKITRVPDTAKFIKGVINLRGQVIPVIDVRIRFNLEEKAYGERTCIIVVNVNQIATGLIVDEVSEVIDIPEKQIDPPPQTGKGSKGKFIKGMGKFEGSVKIILDVEKLLAQESAQKSDDEE